METAEGTFVIDDWVASDLEAPAGHATSTAVVRKTFSGGIAGTSLAHLVLAQTPTEGSMAYVGLERLDVVLDGRGGTFLLMHSALSVRGEATATWTIVPDSGTGGLTGITGTADIQNTGEAVHIVSLGYDLP